MALLTETNNQEVATASWVTAFEAQSRRALQVCDLLEALANELPRKQMPVWRETQYQCKTVLHPHFTLLVDVVFPFLIKMSENSIDREDMLTRLMTDNEDQLHALSDLDDLMSEALASERLHQDPESLGFALRGFFETLRHNLTWELDVVWPLAKRVISSTDAKELSVRLALAAKLN